MRWQVQEHFSWETGEPWGQGQESSACGWILSLAHRKCSLDSYEDSNFCIDLAHGLSPPHLCGGPCRLEYCLLQLETLVEGNRFNSLNPMKRASRCPWTSRWTLDHIFRNIHLKCYFLTSLGSIGDLLKVWILNTGIAEMHGFAYGFLGAMKLV